GPSASGRTSQETPAGGRSGPGEGRTAGFGAGAERGEHAAIHRDVDGDGDRALLLLYVHASAVHPVLRQVGEILVLHCALPVGCAGRAADDPRGAAPRAAQGALLHHDAQRAQLLLRLPHLPHCHHDRLRA
ncbi:unnamed protein product, partial [Lampetra planeri]